MAEVYNVGKEEYLDSDGMSKMMDSEGVLWCVYCYETGDYCGYGELVAFRGDEKSLLVHDMGHCSCYDGMDDFPEKSIEMSAADYLADTEDIHSRQADPAVKTKVAELLRPAMMAAECRRRGGFAEDVPACVLADWCEENGHDVEAAVLRSSKIAGRS